MDKKGRTNRLLSRLAVGLMLAAMALFTGCPNKITVKPVTFEVTFSAGEHGTLKAKAEGIAETETSPITIEQGKTVTFRATPDSGYRVKGWMRDGEAVNGTNAFYSFTVIKGVEVKVSFESNSTPPTPSAPADKIYTVGGISFTMKGIAAVTNGTLGHADYSSNNDVHMVSLTAYRIGETEVTQELWKNVMGNEPSYFNGNSGKEAAEGEVQGKRPVENVNWYHAIAFCNKLSLKLGLTPCYTVEVSGSPIDFDTLAYSAIPTSNNTDWDNTVLDMSKNGFRLPTEAEWEWAAKGGTENKWAGTDDQTQLGTYAWYNENSGNKTHEVKKKQPNGYGLYDMSGNVWEWCWDRYDTLPNPLPEDYSGADSGSARVLRGGGWRSVADGAARAVRGGGYPGGSGGDLGLRVVSRP